MRIAVLLGGCGLYDGTDVHDAVLTLLALEGHGEKPLLVAPAIPQDRTIDHLTGDEVPGEVRDVLSESARLARGRIQSLAECRPADLEALIIPGGYGPAVNFSTGFARLGAPRRIVPEIAEFVRHFLDSGKPIGLVGLGEIPVRTILGQEMESPSSPGGPGTPVVDPERRIVHTPGSGGFGRLRDGQAGIEAMVREVLRLIDERRTQAAADAPAREAGR